MHSSTREELFSLEYSLFIKQYSSIEVLWEFWVIGQDKWVTRAHKEVCVSWVSGQDKRVIQVHIGVFLSRALDTGLFSLIINAGLLIQYIEFIHIWCELYVDTLLGVLH